MPDQQRYRNDDLMLRVSNNIDPSRLDINIYEPFIDALCGTREYQKEAIRIVLRYFLGGRYTNLNQLAEESFHSSVSLRERYGTFQEMARHLQLPTQLACTVDLATATGKSFAMYGIARIMLAHGDVDRVLVLCPSRTIKRGLIKKFRALSADAALKSLLPEDARVRNPHTIDGTESIIDGSICIENFHATLQHVKSSIRDSLTGKGNRTLILNDEVHHVYSPPRQDLKRWKEFLIEPEFGFRYIAGFSGTCYIGDEYFSDVVCRYSLNQAIEQGYAKSIDYVSEDISDSPDERFQKIYDNHLQNKYFYRRVKPLTIFVMRDIPDCKSLTKDIIEFLARHEGVSAEDAAKKVLIVTSNAEHAANVRLLDEVDSPDNAVEWITSVSMLTEGWDVQNVFQIVPGEERAFNSKLLIAQVMGRGLRIPNAYRGERPIVKVFNHAAWSGRIKHLVDEVMEYEKRVYSYPVAKSPDYNFVLHKIDYDKKEEMEEFQQDKEYEFNKGFITLISQNVTLELETTYTHVMTGTYYRKKTLVSYQMFPAAEVAEHVFNHYNAIDLENDGKSNFAESYPLKWILNLIRESLRRVGETKDIVSAENRQRILAALGITQRGSAKRVRYRMVPDALSTISTTERPRDSIGVAMLRRQDAFIFLDDSSLELSDEDTEIILQEILEDDSLPHSAWQKINNTYHFKTPLNLVIADHKPERDFIRYLIKSENAAIIDAWIKSTDRDFYPIEFGWRKGEHPKRGFFNPDFFIKKGNHILAVEIKSDEELAEPSDENKGKSKAAHQHFETLNQQQIASEYHFHFLTPRDYDGFFQFLRDNNFHFGSRLDAAIEGGND
jgi:type III restriction enzyme